MRVLDIRLVDDAAGEPVTLAAHVEGLSDADRDRVAALVSQLYWTYGHGEPTPAQESTNV